MAASMEKGRGMVRWDDKGVAGVGKKGGNGKRKI